MTILRPDYYETDVCAIDLDALDAAGVRALIIDLDNTLLPRDTGVVPDAVVEWLGTTRERFRVTFVSNNWHQRVHEVSADLGCPLVARAVKPLPFAFLAALRDMGVRPSSCAVIGDQLFTDVLGGKLIGARTVLVQPQSTTDLTHTLLLRKLEARIMRGVEPGIRKDRL